MKRFTVENNKCFWILYTFLFCLIASIVFLAFILKGKSFIWATDGFNQTYPVLIYIGEYLREWIREGFKIKEFDFSLGLGEGVISALSCSGFGDVFTLFSVFVRPEWSACLFNLIVLFKFYAAGITFSIYCRSLGLHNKYILIGVFFYVFNRFSLVSGLEFYQNLNPAVWLPLLFLGIDKIIKNRKAYPFFIVTIAVQGMNGFYYLYMETIICVIYFLVRYFTQERVRLSVDSFLRNALCIVWQYLLGLMISAPLLLPALVGYFDSSRTGRASTSIKDLFLYPLERYGDLIGHLFIPGTGESSLTVPILTVICIIIAWKEKKGEKAFRILATFSIIAYMIPVTGSIMNGFSYSLDRWSYVVYLWGAVLAVQVLESMSEIRRSAAAGCAAVMAVSLAAQFFADARSGAVFLRNGGYVLLFCAFLFCIYFRKIPKRAEGKVIFAFAVFNVCLNGLVIYGPVVLGGNGFSGGFRDGKVVYEEVTDSIADTGRKENGFYRLDVYDASLCSSLVLDYNGTAQYFSIANDNTYQFFREMSISPGIRSASHILKGLDGREVLEAVLSVKYYQNQVRNEEEVYRPVLEENKMEIPFGFLYTDAVSRQDFDGLDDFQRMDVLTQQIVLEEDFVDSSTRTEFSNTEILDTEISFTDIVDEEDSLQISEGSRIEISIPDKVYASGELYVQLKGLRLFDEGTADIAIGNKDIQIRNGEDPYYMGEEDFLVHIDTPKDGKIEISFSKDCRISLEELQVYWYPLEKAEERIAELKKHAMEELAMDEMGGALSGRIEAPSDAWLFFSIPFSRGWSAQVDGKAAELVRANIGFMAVHLSEGSHQIRLEYSAPGTRAGSLLAAAGWLSLVILLIIEWRRREQR